MQIQEFSRQAYLPAITIRYYEEISLLPPPRRLENGYRDYDEADVTRARLVAGARRLDFSLDDIQEILDLRDRQIAPCRVVLDLLAERIVTRTNLTCPECSHVVELDIPLDY